jgi:hypothetical protein
MKKEIPPYTMTRLLVREVLHRKADALKKRGEMEVHIQYFHPYEKFVKQYYD